MSRRKSQWKRRAIQAGGSVDKTTPRGAPGSGLWLTKEQIPGREMGMPSPRSTEGSSVTAPMGTRKEQLVRQWCKF